MTVESTVELRVDLTAATPVYEQLRAQIAGCIGAGLLHRGDRLPTVRALAADLGIAVNTVGRAYAELEGAGLVRSGRRVGTVVTGPEAAAVSREVTAAANAFTATLIAGSVSDEAAVEILRHSLRQARAQPRTS